MGQYDPTTDHSPKVQKGDPRPHIQQRIQARFILISLYITLIDEMKVDCCNNPSPEKRALLLEEIRLTRDELKRLEESNETDMKRVKDLRPAPFLRLV